ncbi:UNVERIFIED_ORG: hypothetical protein J2W82_004361 [Pseudomonas mohnii]|jgi:hypothetical protein|nr:hypothetical protein [Pseudomonas mohnii]
MRKGLFIGINDYTHVSSLRGCSNDAMAMASVLKTDANGDPNFKNIVLTSAEDYLSREKLVQDRPDRAAAVPGQMAEAEQRKGYRVLY